MKTFTANRGRYEIIVDDEDYDDIMELPRIKEGTKNHRLKWVVVGGKVKYRVRTGPQNGPFVYLHRYIMCPGKGECVIFLTENRLDHRKENMKVVPSWSVRVKGGKKKDSDSSQYRGVLRRTNGWCAYIRTNGVNNYLGLYLDELHAARAYDIKAKELHGEYAVLNNVPDDIIPIKRRGKKSGKSTSKFFGVYFNKKDGSWNAMIRVKEKRKFLGVYVEEIHAARAYDIAAKKYRGPDEATNNIPESVIPVRGKQRNVKRS